MRGTFLLQRKLGLAKTARRGAPLFSFIKQSLELK